MGEGSGILVLESLSHAKKRGANILARVAAVGMSADAHHMSAPREDGEGVRLAIEMALRDAGISPKDVGYVNTHGTSTPLGDVAECSALEKVFGARDSLKVNSSKCMIGHALGAAGALEAIITVKSLQNQMVHATRNVFNQDERIHLDVCANKNTSHSFKYALSDGFGFGGQNSVLLLARD
jgi:3-oxoacyl-[acyl-carrier-protein] synthase II